MDWPPAVVVHGFDQARLALRPGLPVTLLSGFGAGLYGGAAWWRALVASACAAEQRSEAPSILDCADAPGAAMAALRAGQRAVVLDPACPAYAAVSVAARGCHAVVLSARPSALDMDAPGRPETLAAWLAGDDRCPGLG